MKVDLQDVITAILEADNETAAFYSPRQEKIVYHFQFDPSLDTFDFDEEEDLIELPDRHRINDYHNMELFIETVDDDNTAEWLRNAIHGRGAFRMFRATLERFGLTEEWYDFLDRQHRILAIEWCEENGIEYESSYASVDDDEEDDDEEDYSFGFHTDYLSESRQTSQPTAELPKEVRIVSITSHNSTNIIYMHADYLKETAALKGIRREQDIELAQAEIDRALAARDAVFAAVKDGRYVGYMILQQEPEMVLRTLYVKPDFRRRGIGTTLFAKAEETAENEGRELSVIMKPYIEKMLHFLSRSGFDHLEEIRLIRGGNADDDSGSIALLHSQLKY